MRKTYIIPSVRVDVAEMADGLLTVTSITVSDESGSEEYVKEQDAGDGTWDIDW